MPNVTTSNQVSPGKTNQWVNCDQSVHLSLLPFPTPGYVAQPFSVSKTTVIKTVHDPLHILICMHQLRTFVQLYISITKQKKTCRHYSQCLLFLIWSHMNTWPDALQDNWQKVKLKIIIYLHFLFLY